jgi:hypothetical protein
MGVLAPQEVTIESMVSALAKQLLHCNAATLQSGSLPVAAIHLSTSF